MKEREEHLRTRFSQLKDEYLIKIIKVDYKEYEDDAIKLVKEELDSRGIDYSDTSVCETMIINKQPLRYSFRDEVFKKKYRNAAVTKKITQIFIWVYFNQLFYLLNHH